MKLRFDTNKESDVTWSISNVNHQTNNILLIMMKIVLTSLDSSLNHTLLSRFLSRIILFYSTIFYLMSILYTHVGIFLFPYYLWMWTLIFLHTVNYPDCPIFNVRSTFVRIYLFAVFEISLGHTMTERFWCWSKNRKDRRSGSHCC